VGIDRETFTLAERYTRRDGDVLLTGVQAVVRVLVDQLRADRSRGLNTAGFVSGYPGSPLGGFDQTLQRMDKSQLNIHHVSGLNEELVATAIWGSQQNHLAPLKDLDGVIGMWYGKTPGLDRSGDALRHANLHGAGTNGGVVLAVGDDPSSKSSTLPGSCEHALVDLSIPIFSPGTVQEVIDFGRCAFEMSRATGLYVGLKIVTAVADGFGIARIDSHRQPVIIKQFKIGESEWSFVQRPRFFIPDTLEMEKELYECRIPAAIQFIAANEINRITVSSTTDSVGLVASGRTYVELRQALLEIGLNDAALTSRGVRLMRLGAPYPLEPGIIDRFAHGLTRIIVVEEKRSFIERQIRDLLYDTEQIINSLCDCVMPDGALVVDFVSLAENVFRDHMPANLIALGAAYQFGALPISAESIESAITVNGAAVERSLLAFRLGRLVVADPQLIERRFSSSRPGKLDPSPSTSARAYAQDLVAEHLPIETRQDLSTFVTLLAAELIDYQNRSLAERYVITLASLVRRELEVSPNMLTGVDRLARAAPLLSRAAARHLFRLMAYKDEYEVARLHLNPKFQTEIGRMVPGNRKKRYMLQPPIMKSLGLKGKIRLPPFLAQPTFSVLCAMKIVRGTPFDPFGRADMRKLERSLVEEYCTIIADICTRLNGDKFAAALRLMESPELIRGYADVKLAWLDRYRLERDAALKEFNALSSRIFTSVRAEEM